MGKDSVVYVSGKFDDLRSRDVRFLQEAARLGPLHVLLWSDELVRSLTGAAPAFGEAERWYLVLAMRTVSHMTLIDDPATPDGLPVEAAAGAGWAVRSDEVNEAKRLTCAQRALQLRVIPDAALEGFPVDDAPLWELPTRRKKVIVTGCYDWLHSGHVRFFEEVSELGDLYVAVGNDTNVRHLKGEGHPLLSEDERRYMVGSIRYVKQAVVTKGMGWMDAAPNIEEIRPDIYAVNDDGDVPEKAAFCVEHGLEYVVLKREPKPGLERRSSTELRGF
jgi:cytidyltransferase-like protein